MTKLLDLYAVSAVNSIANLAEFPLNLAFFLVLAFRIKQEVGSAHICTPMKLFGGKLSVRRNALWAERTVGKIRTTRLYRGLKTTGHTLHWGMIFLKYFFVCTFCGIGPHLYVFIVSRINFFLVTKTLMFY